MSFNNPTIGFNIEEQYLKLLHEVLSYGQKTSDRTGTGTLSCFGAQIKHDFSTGFPLLTTKKVFWKGVVEELLWMLRGETNIKSLQEKGVHIWDAWADEKGDLGPVYGKQWRKWSLPESDCDWVNDSIDQIKNVIERIKAKPDDRRLIVSAWNPADIESMKLPPCHCFFQFKVYGKKLYCQLFQRSADLFLGVPFNIASYSLLTYIIAYMTDLEPGGFIHTFGDAHIYLNHVKQAEEQLKREPRNLPTVYVNWLHGRPLTDPSDFSFNDIVLHDYNPHPSIKAEVSV